MPLKGARIVVNLPQSLIIQAVTEFFNIHYGKLIDGERTTYVQIIGSQNGTSFVPLEKLEAVITVVDKETK